MVVRGAALLSAAIVVNGVEGVGIKTRETRTLETADKFVEYIIGDQKGRR